MARKQGLVTEVAQIAGMNYYTVERHYRHLYALDLLTKAGRGAAAAVMTRRDATRLMIAVAITPSPLLGAPVVGHYESLLPHAPYQERLTALGLSPDLPLYGAMEALAMQSPDDRRGGYVLFRSSQATASIWARIPGSDAFAPEEIPFVPHADFLTDAGAALQSPDFARQSRLSLDLLHDLYRFIDEEAARPCAA